MGDSPLLRVFVSYRREDTAGYAGRLYDSLTSRLDVADVFMDVGNIEPGVDFTVAIADAVESCDVMLALIGSRWVTAVTPEGRRRLEDADDYVAAEIGAALERHVRVIPVLIENTPMPAADSLPERLRGLARRNAIELSTVSWRTDLEALVAALHRLTPQSRPPSQPTVKNLPTNLEATADASTTAGRPAPPSDRQPLFRRRRVRAAVAGAAIAAVLLLVAIALTGGDNSSDQADEYVGAISEGLGTNSCVASAIVDVIGLEDLEAEATPDEIREDPDVLENLSEDEANNIYDNLSECPADKTYLIAQASGVIGSDEDLTTQVSECVRRQFDEDLARQILVAELIEAPDTSLDDTVKDAAGALDPLQPVPESGPAGTTVELSGECTQPDGWSNGGVAFGMYDQEGTDTIPGIDIPLDPDGFWQGQLPIPDGTSAGTYHIWANCYGENSNGETDRFHYYRDAEFSVTNP